MSNVVQLRFDESIFFDPHTLKLLYNSIGGERAMHVLQEALRLIELHVEVILKYAPYETIDAIAPSLKTIEIISENLGLVALSLVCADAQSCQEPPQSHSFRAIMSRFERLARQSPVSLRMVSGQ